ncbi:MAG: hypothetical protein RLY17_2167, partial [Pseudomonadota bacterium]
VDSSFKVKTQKSEIYLKCKYCEKEFDHQVVIQTD